MKETVLLTIMTLALAMPIVARPADDSQPSQVPRVEGHSNVVPRVEGHSNVVPRVEGHSNVRLTEVIANPDAFRSAPFSFVGQFHGFGKIFSPFYTVFESSRYLNFGAWDDEAQLWNRQTYRKVYPLLYMTRDRYGQVDRLLELDRFDRFQATAIVRSSFKNRAWIEVLDLKPLDEHLNPETLGNMIVAMRHKQAEEYDLASLRFSEAYKDNLPAFARRTLRYQEGECLIAAGAYQAAVVTLAHAVEEFPNNRNLQLLHQRAVAYVQRGPKKATATAPVNRPSPAVTKEPPFSRLEGLQKVSKDNPPPKEDPDTGRPPQDRQDG